MNMWLGTHYHEAAFGPIGNAYVNKWEDFFTWKTITTIYGERVCLKWMQRRRIETDYMCPYEYRFPSPVCLYYD